jgi:sugar transferase (PEP-CTERM system associated)
MPYIFNKYYPARNIAFIAGEGLLIFFSLVIVQFLFDDSTALRRGLYGVLSQALLVTVVFQLCLYFFDLYELRQYLSLLDTATRVTQSFGVGCILLGLIYYVLPVVLIPAVVFWTSYFVMYLLVLVWRGMYYSILRRGMFVPSVAIIGTGKLAGEIAKEITGRYDAPYRIRAFIGPPPEGDDLGSFTILEKLETIHQELLDHKIDRLVVALDDRRGMTPIEQLLEYKLNGIMIDQGVGFFEKLTAKILVEKVDPSWIVFSDGFSSGKIMQLIKRSGDIALSLTLLGITFPLMILAAIIIKLESPGPIFYFQERVGKGRRIFRVIKFRSMVADAEKNGAVWASANDSRVTRFGSFMRKTRIDELPQLFNVIKGEMSMVGPRPERPVFVEELKKTIPFYDIRHDIRPGVTGWAQVCYSYGASEKDALRKLEYDLYYMKHVSFFLDLVVILRTVKTVLFAKGSR